jgi:hypothetical protein
LPKFVAHDSGLFFVDADKLDLLFSVCGNKKIERKEKFAQLLCQRHHAAKKKIPGRHAFDCAAFRLLAGIKAKPRFPSKSVVVGFAIYFPMSASKTRPVKPELPVNQTGLGPHPLDGVARPLPPTLEHHYKVLTCTRLREALKVRHLKAQKRWMTFVSQGPVRHEQRCQRSQSLMYLSAEMTHRSSQLADLQLRYAERLKENTHEEQEYSRLTQQLQREWTETSDHVQMFEQKWQESHQILQNAGWKIP